MSVTLTSTMSVACRLRARYQTSLISLAVGDELCAYAEDSARRDRPRVQRWDSVLASTDLSLRHVDVQERNAGRYSSRITWKKTNYHPTVRCCARIGLGGKLGIFFVGADCHKLRAPRGWVFGTDILGVYLVRTNETREQFRCHLDSDHVSHGIAALRSLALAHEATQKQALRAQSALSSGTVTRRGVTVPVYVTLQDSVAAGNCAVGTRAFASACSIDPRCHAPARLLLKHAAKYGAGRVYQVQRAVAVASARTLADLDRGFCILK